MNKLFGIKYMFVIMFVIKVTFPDYKIPPVIKYKQTWTFTSSAEDTIKTNFFYDSLGLFKKYIVNY